MREDSLLKFVAHYIQRIWELGLLGTLQRVWTRFINILVVWSQSLWWGWRARQEMSDKALLAHTVGNWRSVDVLLNHLASRSASSFLLPHESPLETAQLLDHYYPEHLSALFAAADAACRNEFSLNSQVFNYSHGIDWHREPVSGWQWPHWHISRLDQYLGSRARPADLRFSWEFNRHQHFITLGVAYWLTGEQRYVDAFTSQLQSWIETNPLQHGINWYSSLEISMRLIAWTVAFQFFRRSVEFRGKAGRAFLKSLWQQADFLSSHLTDMDDVPNNHIIGELTGLALVGTAFPEFGKAQTWRDTSLRMLDKQITEQTHPDGVNKEQATGYHRFVAELLLLTVTRHYQSDLGHNPIIVENLEHMLDYMLFCMTPIRTAPLWGDADYSRVLGLGKNKDFFDFRPLLSTGAALFGRPDWKFAAGTFDVESFWLLGAQGLEQWEHVDVNPPEQTSRAFPQAGHYIIRDSWASDADVAFFRCGPFGLGGEGHCAHAHSDLLSFVLWVHGQPLLVDSGTFTYHGPWRDHFRLTGGHNTVMVDSRNQAIPLHNFNWQQTSEAECIEWTSKRVKAVLTYPDSVRFIRDLIHLGPGKWELTDKFTGHNTHKLEWFFHFAPGLDLQLNEEMQLLTVLKEGNPFLIVHMPVTGIRSEVRDSWYSYQYGVKQSNRELYMQWQDELDSNGKSFQWQFELVNDSRLPTG